MKLLKEEVRKVYALISSMDECTDRATIDAGKVRLARWFDRRESPLLLRLEQITDKASSETESDPVVQEARQLVEATLTAIRDSGYLGVDPKMPIKKNRGRPIKQIGAGPENPYARAKLTKKVGRFILSQDYANILDELHQKPEYKISMYEGISASKAVEVIKLLLSAVGNKETGGWVKNEKSWRGAFQSGVYRLFKLQQIEVGKKKNGHNGFWRLITDGEFDTLSSAGKFYKRCKQNTR